MIDRNEYIDDHGTQISPLFDIIDQQTEDEMQALTKSIEQSYAVYMMMQDRYRKLTGQNYSFMG